MLPTDLFRVDPLTGCNNFLSFVEALDRLALPGERPPVSVLYSDLNYLQVLNQTRGMVYGDSVIRWMGLVLGEESGLTTYRIGGDEFATLFTEGTFLEHEAVLRRILERLGREAPHLEIPSPAASIALVHYEPGSRWSPDEVLLQMDKAMAVIKMEGERNYRIFFEQELEKISGPAEKYLADSYHWTSQRLLRRFVHMGRLLDEAQQVAYIDSISELPNMRAAMRRLEQALGLSASSGRPFAILLIDGDNLRLYNDISYAAGDEMIRNIGRLLSGRLRPGDFLARWRSGDEFLAVLQETDGSGAGVVAERFLQAVKEGSQAWQFPTSISIGIAVHPLHGGDIQSLVDQAEAALKRAKEGGKDRALLAGE